VWYAGVTVESRERRVIDDVSDVEVESGFFDNSQRNNLRFCLWGSVELVSDELSLGSLAGIVYMG
jgi:hypothetical protein